MRPKKYAKYWPNAAASKTNSNLGCSRNEVDVVAQTGAASGCVSRRRVSTPGESCQTCLPRCHCLANNAMLENHFLVSARMHVEVPECPSVLECTSRADPKSCSNFSARCHSRQNDDARTPMSRRCRPTGNRCVARRTAVHCSIILTFAKNSQKFICNTPEGNPSTMSPSCFVLKMMNDVRRAGAAASYARRKVSTSMTIFVWLPRHAQRTFNTSSKLLWRSWKDDVT